MIHDLDLILELVRSEVTRGAGDRRAGADPARRHRQRARRIRQRRRGARDGEPDLAGAHAQAAHLPAHRLFLARPGAGERGISTGSSRAGRRWGATSIEDIVEHVRLDAPEAEPLKLELESFLRAVRGRGRGRGVGGGGRAGARARPGASPTRSRPRRSPPCGRDAARRASTSRPGSPRGTRTRPPVVAALRRRLRDVDDRGVRRSALEAAAGARVLDRMEAYLGRRASSRRSGRHPAPLPPAAARALPRSARAATTSPSSWTTPAITCAPRPRRRAAGRPGALLHRAAAVGLGRRPGAPAGRRRAAAGGDPAVRGAVLPRARRARHVRRASPEGPARACRPAR